ncbi:hypothetical protein EUTSA_v10026423mg [Eutrema salsugineum]|uniref:Uncharacterized protein n=1 Tax=Eutrema salsugineum TaxID=72664 RepID=V4LYI6_EUTSA|nr:lysine-rich arabinogalactan protein 19 [Eutrema salsugineum]ESQ55740.1 hypothetical protein EUTSA_v10026423mg [Eutrema salsugineum]
MASSQALLLVTLPMVLIHFSLAQSPMMAPSGSMSMPPMSSGRSSPMPMMTPPPMPMAPPPMPMTPPPMPMAPPPMPMTPPPMMPMTPSSSPMAQPTTPMGPSPSPLSVPDMASPPMPPSAMESAPSPGPMPPGMASQDSGAFNVRNNVVALSFVVGVAAAHLLIV